MFPQMKQIKLQIFAEKKIKGTFLNGKDPDDYSKKDGLKFPCR